MSKQRTKRLCVESSTMNSLPRIESRRMTKKRDKIDASNEMKENTHMQRPDKNEVQSKNKKSYGQSSSQSIAVEEPIPRIHLAQHNSIRYVVRNNESVIVDTFTVLDVTVQLEKIECGKQSREQKQEKPKNQNMDKTIQNETDANDCCEGDVPKQHNKKRTREKNSASSASGRSHSQVIGKEPLTVQTDKNVQNGTSATVGSNANIRMLRSGTIRFFTVSEKREQGQERPRNEHVEKTIQIETDATDYSEDDVPKQPISKRSIAEKDASSVCGHSSSQSIEQVPLPRNKRIHTIQNENDDTDCSKEEVPNQQSDSNCLKFKKSTKQPRAENNASSSRGQSISSQPIMEEEPLPAQMDKVIQNETIGSNVRMLRSGTIRSLNVSGGREQRQKRPRNKHMDKTIQNDTKATEYSEEDVPKHPRAKRQEGKKNPSPAIDRSSSQAIEEEEPLPTHTKKIIQNEIGATVGSNVNNPVLRSGLNRLSTQSSIHRSRAAHGHSSSHHNNEIPMPKTPKRKSNKIARRQPMDLQDRMNVEAPKNYFVLGEIVLATVPGYCPWPARILDILNETLMAEFFGTGQINPIRSDSIRRFDVTRVIPLMNRKGYTKAMRELEMALHIPNWASVNKK